MVRRIRGLSDKALAWLFITPTIVLLLAINIFPLIWTIYLSFTNYRANRPNAPVKWLGIDWYQTILTDPDIWAAMQVTAHFVFWTVVIETVLGFGLAFLIDKKFRGHGVLDHDHPAADDAFAGRGRQFLDVPLPAADRALQLCGRLPHRLAPHRRSRCWAT